VPSSSHEAQQDTSVLFYDTVVYHSTSYSSIQSETQEEHQEKSKDIMYQGSPKRQTKITANCAIIIDPVNIHTDGSNIKHIALQTDYKP
jgi:hypothetical protein